MRLSFISLFKTMLVKSKCSYFFENEINSLIFERRYKRISTPKPVTDSEFTSLESRKTKQISEIRKEDNFLEWCLHDFLRNSFSNTGFEIEN